MFTTTGDPLPSQRDVERTGVSNDLLDCFPITSTPQGIVCVVIERNVQHGTQVEIESEKAEQPAGDVTVMANEFDVVLVAQLLSVRRLVADQPETRNAPSFLIDCNDRLDLA